MVDQFTLDKLSYNNSLDQSISNNKVRRREDSDGMDMWNAPMVQSRQPLTYRLMESVGHQDDMEAGDREGLQRLEALCYQPS